MADFHPLDPRRSTSRLFYALLIGAIAWFTSATFGLAWITRALIAGDAAGFTLFALAAWTIVPTTSRQTRARSAAEDTGRSLVWMIVLVASTFAMFSATFVLREAKELEGRESTLVLVLVIASAVLSWLLIHTSFTLRYAHLFYRDGLDEEGGIEFPHEDGTEAEDPDDLDFAYFAFTIGMCFQVSDSEISDRTIRRTVLAHAILSFVYNTGIIALVLNVATSRVG
ncbi:DUF1345 domain-containing protein [soil metagenome]